MILSHFIHLAEKTITGVICAIACTFAVMYFGQSQVFDPIVMVVAISLAVLFRRNKNLLSLLIIVAGEKAIEELTWLIFDNTLFVKVPLYAVLLIVIPIFSASFLRVYLLLFVGTATVAELYWYSTGYESPWIFWQVWMCVLAAIARRMVAMRVFWMIDLSDSKEYDFIKLDDHIYYVYTVLIAIYSLMTFEYYVRHFLGFSDVTYMYDSLGYFTGFTSSFVIYMLVVESLKYIKRGEMGA